MDELVSLRRDLAESQILLDQHTTTIQDLTQNRDTLDQKKIEIENRLSHLEQEYEELLDKTIHEEETVAQKNADIEDTLSAVRV
jgi:kinesin family protein 5